MEVSAVGAVQFEEHALSSVEALRAGKGGPYTEGQPGGSLRSVLRGMDYAPRARLPTTGQRSPDQARREVGSDGPLDRAAALLAYKKTRVRGWNPDWVRRLQRLVGAAPSGLASMQLAQALATHEVAAGREPTGRIHGDNLEWLLLAVPELRELPRTADAVEHGPGALAWPYRMATELPLNERRTLGLFPRPAGTSEPRAAMYVLCNDASCTADEPVGCLANPACLPNNPVWVESTFLKPGDRADGQASLAYKFMRSPSGLEQQDAAGHLMVTRHVGDRPFMTVSEWTSRTRRPGEASTVPGANSSPWTALHTGDWFRNSWTRLGDGGNLALYSDAQVANVFGLSSMGPNSELTFWPHADGAPDQEFRVGSDFKVMRGEVCRKLRFPTNAYHLGSESFSHIPSADGFCGAFSVETLVP